MFEESKHTNEVNYDLLTPMLHKKQKKKKVKKTGL